MKVNSVEYPTLKLEERALFEKIISEYESAYREMIKLFDLHANSNYGLNFFQKAWVKRRLHKYLKKDLKQIRKHIKKAKRKKTK